MRSQYAAWLLEELNAEAAATRKCIGRVPIENFDYKPHAKSMTWDT